MKANICIDTSSTTFKEKVVKLNVHPSTLDSVLHKLANVDGITDPTDAQIMKELAPKNSFTVKKNEIEFFINRNYNKTTSFGNLAEAMKEASYRDSLFGDNTSSVYKDKDGNFVVKTATPTIEGIPFTLDNSIISEIRDTINKDSRQYDFFETIVNLLGEENINIEIGRIKKENTTMRDKEHIQDSLLMVSDSIKRKITIDPINLLKLFDEFNFDKRYRRMGIFDTLCHEMIHQATITILRTPDKQLRPEEYEFKNAIYDLYKEAKLKLNNENNQWYGLEDPFEFISEALTNKYFQRELASIKSDKKVSLWNKFIAAFSKLFKYLSETGKVVDNSILYNVLSATQNYFDYMNMHKAEQEEYDAYIESITTDAVSNPSTVSWDTLEKYFEDFTRTETGQYQFHFKYINGIPWKYLSIPDNVTYTDAVEIGRQILSEYEFDPNDFIFDREHTYNGQRVINVKIVPINKRIARENRLKKESNKKRIEIVESEIKRIDSKFFSNLSAEEHSKLRSILLNDYYVGYWPDIADKRVSIDEVYNWMIEDPFRKGYFKSNPSISRVSTENPEDNPFNIEIDTRKTKKADIKNRESLKKAYQDTVNTDNKVEIAQYAINELNNLYNNYSPKSIYQSDIDKEISDKETELTNKFSEFVKEIKFIKKGDNYSILIIPKDIESIIRNKINDKVDSMTSEEVIRELEAIERGVQLDPEFYLSNKKAEEAKRVISNRNKILIERQIDEAIDFLKTLENTPDMNQYVSLCINWLKDNQIRLPQDSEKLLPLFEYARDNKMDTQKFKTVAEFFKAVIDHKNAHNEVIPATPIKDISKYPGLTFNREESIGDKKVQIFDVEDSSVGQQSVTQILADFMPKSKNDGKPIVDSHWCLSTYNYNHKTGIATPTESAKNFWGKYNKGKRQIAFIDGVPVAFNSSSKEKDEWWDYNDGAHNNWNGWDTIQQIEYVTTEYYDGLKPKSSDNFLWLTNLSVINNTYDNSDIRSVVVHSYNGLSENIVIDSNGNLIKKYTINIKGTNISTEDSIKEIIRKALLYQNFVDFSYFNKLPKNIQDNYISYIGDLLQKIKDEIKQSRNISNVRDSVLNTFRDKFELAINDLSADIIKIQREENDRKYRERVERKRARQETRRQARLEAQRNNQQNIREYTTGEYSATTEEVAEEAIRENNILNTLTNITNIERPYEGSNEEREYLEAREYADQVNREYDTNIEPETVLDAQEHIKAKTLQQLYEKGVKQKVNKELSDKLHDILKKYHFEIIEGDLKEMFGEDALGALDILEKIVYLAKEEDRNALTDVEEFAHAFIEMMGSKYRGESTRKKHPENKLFSELRDLVEHTSLYQETLNEYRDTYQTADHNPDLAKIKKEALGKALASVILNRFEVKSEADKSFFNKIKQWFNDIIQSIKGILKGNEDRLISELNKIADSIITGKYESKYLKDFGIEGKLNQNYQEIVENQTAKDGGKTLSIMQTLNDKGLILSGSLALRTQGTIYRTNEESLHDLDYSADPNVYGFTLGEKSSYYMTQEEQQAFAEKVINSRFIMDLRESLPENDIISAYKADRNGVISLIICDDASIRERFINDTGNYSSRLDKFTQAERDKITLLDIFLNEFTKKTTTINGIGKVMHSSEIFDAKLRMGRAKDIFDYQHFNPVNRERRTNNRNIMFQKQEKQWARTATNSYEVSTQGDSRFSALKAKFKPGTIIDGVDVSNRTIENVYQNVIKKSGKGKAPSVESKLYKPELKTKKEQEDFSYREGYLPLWQEWAKQNPELIQELREKSSGKVLTDKFASTRVSQARALAEILNSTPETITTENTNNISSLKTFTNHSGGAKGADSYWGEVGEKYGVTSKHYHAEGAKTPKGNTPVSKENLQEADEHLKKANETLDRRFPTSNEYVNNLLRRNWQQVKNADAIFAIGHISNNIVDGGTGWAVQMAIDNGKPVHVFDQVTNKWYEYNNGKWVEESTPVLTPNFAGIGTRDINEAGKRAIEEVYENTQKSLQRSLNTEKETSNTKQETQDQEQSIKKENQSYMKKAVSITKQINNLYNSDVLSATEVRHIAEQAVYWISDTITEYENNPEKLFVNFPSKRTLTEINGKKVWTDENKQKDIEKVRNLDSRAAIVNFIGADDLMTFCKEKFNPENTEFDSFDTYEKAYQIIDNWDAIMMLAYDAFLGIEDFSMKSSKDGLHMEVVEDVKRDIDDFNVSNELDDILEKEGDVQEHWQVETRTLDVLSTMSQIVRRALSQCYILNKDGSKVKSEFGINERVSAREATNSILRWTQGALNLEQMIIKLQAKAEDNPWVTQIIKRLSDNSGKEVDFQSQFYQTFCKDFQTYSVVVKQKDKFISMIINEEPALKQAVKGIEVQRKAGEHPLFTLNGISDAELSKLITEYNTISKEYDLNDPNIKKEVARTIGYISNLLGYYVTPEMVEIGLNKESLRSMKNALHNIVRNLESNKNDKLYDPFDFKKGIKGNIRNFLKPITDHLEDIAVSATYDSGKMYQSYVIPSYTSRLLQRFKQTGEDFVNFIKEEYDIPWFHDSMDIEKGWRNEWLRLLINDNKAKEIFKHKVQLNFNKHNYMKTMSDMEYALSLITEYFSESGTDMVPAWFKMPMQSNKPSSEFIRFYSYRGENYKDTLTNLFIKIFNQELSRIQTVEMRNLSEGDKGFITNFDTNGKKFMFLDFMNKFLSGDKKNTELGKLIRQKLDGNKVDEVKLNDLVFNEIKTFMDNKAKSIVSTWAEQGIVEGAKKVSNIGTTEEEIINNLENFVWNDTFASMNIMQLMITDIAYYKDAEDLQKRLAQLHAPGLRGNIYATDYGKYDSEGNMIEKPQRISDGKYRTFILSDYSKVISNIIDNVAEVFDRRIERAKQKGDETEIKIATALKESLVGEKGLFRDINVADAQGFNCPTSYRKKAFIFGKWSTKAEEIYQKLKESKYTYSDLALAFQPLKPFVYDQIIKNLELDAPLSKLKIPVQYKNSEYLLIMADAILQGEETSKPNLLRAIFEVMEESHFDENGNYKTDGIDTVQFESAVKSGLMNPINLNDLVNNPNGEAIAKARMEASIYESIPEEIEVLNPKTNQKEKKTIYRRTGKYNLNTVDEASFNSFCLQQEIPAHFMDKEQSHGSQARYITISELEGMFNLEGESVSAQKFKEEYEKTIAENIQESINTLIEDLSLDKLENVKDRNIALSKILQREILSSPRYGIDLLQACSVDENGKFRIPLGDSIQSKRIEQLINSIIKNRINKQKLPGGPVVQVTNFGTSKQLNIVFKSKDGKLLKTRSEFKGTDEEYKKYIKENQGAIAHFECFAPIYTRDLFSKFADKDGNIDITTIERINPDLLKMVGYRIPTEDKYSMIPLKIVGFLPREAGDGIMLPYDITLLTGSDFDIDKMYIMLKKLGIATRFIQKEGETMTEAEEDYFKHNKPSIRKHLIESINLTGKLRKEEYIKIEKEAEKNAKLQIDAIEREYDRRLEEINKIDDQIAEKNDKISKDSSYDWAEKKRNKSYERAVEKLDNWKSKQLTFIEVRRQNEVERESAKLERKKVYEKVDEFLTIDKYQSSKLDDALTAELRKAYTAYMYHTVAPTKGKEYRDNKIVDMTYEVLTHESSVEKLLNPGGFDEQKRMGYAVNVFRMPDNKYTWEELYNMPIKQLKYLSNRSKNLSYIDNQIQFYKQNSAAGSLIGIFAVNRAAHAVIESGSADESSMYFINVENACNLTFPLKVAGMEFKGSMPFDMRYDSNGQLIGKTLGSLVASSVDAVKDPILNLMNINKNTANILNTLIRMGMPFDNAALFVSQSVITDILNEYSKENIDGVKSLNSIIKERLDKIKEESESSRILDLEKEELTREELIEGLKQGTKDEIVYKTLNAFLKFQKMANVLRMPTFATRFNSISSAVGPLITDNLIIEHNINKLSQENYIENKEGKEIHLIDIISAHPILESFYQTVNIARTLFSNMPTNSSGFRNILSIINGTNLENVIYNDRKIFNSLSEFYQSYLVMANGVINSKDLKYYINEFPKEFINNNYKEKYSDNLLIQAIKYDINNSSNNVILTVNTTGMDITQKENLSNAWIDLHKKDPELSLKLFKYNFFRGGIGFSPKTFMNLVPVYVKEKIPKYVDTFRILPNTIPEIVLDQFIRNNWQKNKIVPRKKVLFTQIANTKEIKITDSESLAKLGDAKYFKMKIGKEDKLFIRTSEQDAEVVTYKEIDPLGNNGEYIEMYSEYGEKAATETKEAIDETPLADTGKESEISETDTTVDSDAEKTSTDEETLNDILFKILIIDGIRDRQQSQEYINGFKNLSEEQIAKKERLTKKFFENRLKKLRIKYDEKLIDDIYKLICK